MCGVLMPVVFACRCAYILLVNPFCLSVRRSPSSENTESIRVYLALLLATQNWEFTDQNQCYAKRLYAPSSTPYHPNPP